MSNDHSTLRQHRTPIDIEPERFRQLGHDMIDRIADLLSSFSNRPVTKGVTPPEVREWLRSSDSLPANGSDAGQILADTAELLIDKSLYNSHPRFWGYVTASSAPIGMLGDLLGAAVNPNLGSWTLAPVATEIEAQSIRWIAELIGYPTECGGIMVSGGNMANFVGFLAARAHMASKTGNYDVRQHGLSHDNAPKFTVYASREAHTWIQKATDMFGLGTDAIRWIDVDNQRRIEIPALKSALAKDRADGFVPMMVVGSAGTVSTGAMDPLPDLARLCREENIWFHVDGAYGGFAAVADGVDPAIHGLAEADSVAVDPHKWLYAPLEAGCALVRHPELLRDAFSYHPPYYHFDTEAINYFDLGPQNSRGFRALKVWLSLKQLGRAGYKNLIEQDIALATRMYEVAGEHPELEVATLNLSIATFRFVPRDLADQKGEAKTEEYFNELNEKLLERLTAEGRLFVSKALVNGTFLLRACVVNFRTMLSDVDATPAIVVETGHAVDAQLRSAGSIAARER